MANTKISQLTAYTGSASGSFLIINDLTETSTYKITRENLLYDYTASNSENLGGYNHTNYPRLNLINTFTKDQQIVTGSHAAGTYEGDTFYLLDLITNTEIGLSNHLDHFDGPYLTGIYVSSGSNLDYLAAIEIPAGPNFPAPDGIINLKFPTNITGSLRVTGGITGSLQGTATTSSNLNGTSSAGFVSNVTDIYTSTPAITNIISLTQAEYNAISASASSNTLYIII